jgi:hypothetical protein
MRNLLKRPSNTIVIDPGTSRWSPVTVESRQKPLPSLSTCILMDLIGMASYALPFVGELFDLVWAPISAMIYWRMFGMKKGFFGGIFTFVEELLPGFDIIPTFTITWFLQQRKRNNRITLSQLLK